MRNTTEDLNNYLFAELERLNDEGLSDDEMKLRMNHAKTVCGVANSIISNASLALDAAKFKDSALDANAKVPKMLEGAR